MLRGVSARAPFLATTRGGGRFRLTRRIGRGGMGEVFEALDEEGGGRVALKTLPRVDARSLARFKHEFRSVRDLRHPNLIAMHELVRDEAGWFLTMELIEGAPLLDHLRPSSRPPPLASQTVSNAGVTALVGRPAENVSPAPAPADEGPGPLDVGRVRDALAQLCDALAHLHAVGKVHRDIKPSNVLVEPGGRVVVLDLGLVSDDDRKADRAGTPEYMAPEQAAGGRLTTAADLYAVGVIAHQALTGRLPFAGLRSDRPRVRRPGERVDPGPLDDARRAGPECASLADLCEALLAPEPGDRPSATEAARRLGGGARPSADAPRGRRPAFVGRDAELAALWGALAQARAGHAAAVVVSGEAGIGKTALGVRFAADAAAEGALVLSARCSEREHVPFRALDGLVDQIAEHLAARREGADTLDVDVDTDAGVLAHTFPVLAGALELSPPLSAASAASPRARQRRMFEAFRGVLAALARERSCVLLVDDAHWADDDSVALLAHALRAPAPPLLLVLTSRAASPPLARALEGLSSRPLALGALPEDAARELARALVARAGPGSPGDDERVARESGGHPLFLEELARSSGGRAEGLAGLLAAAVAALPDEDRRVLELVALAGRPLRRDVLADAVGRAEAPAKGLGPALHGLRARRLLCSAGEGPDVEPYHARVRDVVLEQLAPAARAARHRELALALEGRGAGDSEALATHWEGAGEVVTAAIHAERAADQALAALAFERAARWYRRAIALAPRPDRLAHLERTLGEALVNAGRGAEAARAFLSAAERSASPPDAAELRGRAAEHLLLSGHIDEGLAILHDELRSAGLPDPPLAGSRASLAALALRRAHVFLRGTSPRARATPAAPAELRRIDLLWALAQGLGLVDTVAGVDAQSRHLLLALRAGDPFRLARALALEAGYLAALRGSEARARRTLAAATRAAEATTDPRAAAFIAVSSCVGAFFRGRYRDCLALGRQAETLLVERCQGSAWELGLARHHVLLALIYLGRMADTRAHLTELVADARDRGDRYGEVYLRTAVAPFLRLAADDPEGCRREALEAYAEWAQPRWRVQQYASLMAVSQSLLYAGHPEAAVDEVARRWPELARSHLLGVTLIYTESVRLRARAALAAAERARGPDRHRLLASARRDTRAVAAERGIPAGPFALLLQASLARLEGEHEPARARLVEAERAFADADMALMATVSRRSRGLLLGGDEGGTLVREADDRMRADAIVAPARLASMLAPGLGHA
ncbi:MAG: serine/threonine-protein kinase [Polyangiaceae bacterium]|nr:serine/threonine-protein kinase [Polyangiaceae bacterium]